MTARRDARRTTSPLAPPVGPLVEMPEELRHRPATPHTVAEYTSWRDRQRAWLEEHDLLDTRGLPMWQRIHAATTAPEEGTE